MRSEELRYRLRRLIFVENRFYCRKNASLFSFFSFLTSLSSPNTLSPFAPSYSHHTDTKFFPQAYQADTAVLPNGLDNRGDKDSAVLSLLRPRRQNAYSANAVDNLRNHHF